MRTKSGLVTAALWLLVIGRCFGAAPEQAVQLVVRDGQLRSHPFVVFMVGDVGPGADPRMTLQGTKLAGPGTAVAAMPVKPLHVVRDQTRIVDLDGVPSALRGTILVFDLSAYRIPWYKSAVRVMPLLEWTEPAGDGSAPAVRRAVVEREVFLGNMAGSMVWTALVIGCVLAGLLAWSSRTSRKITAFTPRPALLLVTGHDGYLSLWRAQLMLWTFAVAGLLFLFGLLRLRVPDIPESLVALMGMSLVTGGLSAVEARKQAVDKAKAHGQGGAAAEAIAKEKSKSPEGAGQGAAAPAPAEVRGELADLVCGWNDTTKQPEMSVPKAQMVVWTVVVLLLFLVKSVLEGELWVVPWELVALTGVSQAGYVSDKVTKRKVPMPEAGPAQGRPADPPNGTAAPKP
jgi:hypothetical protein